MEPAKHRLEVTFKPNGHSIHHLARFIRCLSRLMHNARGKGSHAILILAQPNANLLAMKIKHYTYITLFSLLAIATTACNDDDQKDVTPEPVKITFTEKKWKTEAWDLVKPLDLDEDGDKETDLMQLLIECDLDDFIVFQKDGKFVTNTGSKQCNATDEQESYSANWTYDEAAKIIKMKSVPSGLEKDDWEVLELTETTLKVRFNLLPEDGESAAIKSVMTLKKI